MLPLGFSDSKSILCTTALTYDVAVTTTSLSAGNGGVSRGGDQNIKETRRSLGSQSLVAHSVAIPQKIPNEVSYLPDNHRYVISSWAC